MAVVTKKFTLPSEVLDETPSKLFSQLRRGVAEMRKAEALPQESELLDIGFRRSVNSLEVTLYFALDQESSFS